MQRWTTFRPVKTADRFTFFRQQVSPDTGRIIQLANNTATPEAPGLMQAATLIIILLDDKRKLPEVL